MMKRKIGLWLILVVLAIVLLSFVCSAYAEGWEKFEQPKGTTPTSPKMTYWVYFPKNMRPGLPLVLYLHSSTGMGKAALNDSLPAYIKNGIISDIDAVVVVPQHPGSKENAYWDSTTDSVNNIVENVMETYETDPERVAVTGVSLGGIGVWDIAEAAPGRYKRILSVCGRVKGEKSPENFEGSQSRVYTVPNDKNVNSKSAIEFVGILNEANIESVHIEMQSTHAKVPIYIFGDPEVQEWLWLIEEGTGQITSEAQQTAEENNNNIKIVDDETLSEEWKLKNRSASFNKVVTIKDKTFVLYGQNSPEYCDIGIADQKTTIGGSACSAFALANALINSLSYEDLPILRTIARYPISIDTKNVSYGKGYKESMSFELARDEDLFRYFPLAVINIISGNNVGYGNGMGNTGTYRLFFKKLELETKKTQSLAECMEEVESKGAVAVVCTGSKESPIADKFGHYFVMAYVDGERVYFLDSYVRNTYKLDKNGYIYVQEPGVFWVDKDNLKKLCIYGTKFIVYPKENRTVYTQEDYNRIINLSNQP